MNQSLNTLSPIKLIFLTSLALIAFAANSVLCRMALANSSIDPASFTLIRLISGAVILTFVCLLWSRISLNETLKAGNWRSAICLFAYAAGFSFAYISLESGIGALILFGSVQITMMSISLYKGERLRPIQIIGFVAAIVGLVFLLVPDLFSSDNTTSKTSDSFELIASVLMAIAGIAWGLYSLLGQGVTNAGLATTGNFLKASLIGLVLFALYYVIEAQAVLSTQGLILALVSGAITSGLGYTIWYAVLPHLKGTSAASLQLTVPVIAAIGGLLFIQEPIGIQLIISSLLILGGVALVIKTKKA